MLFNNFEGDCRRVHVPYGDHSEPKLQVESHICHAFPYPLYKNQGQKKRFLLADFIIVYYRPQILKHLLKKEIVL